MHESRSVLVIDDDALLREALKQSLEADGFQVTGTSSGGEGHCMMAAEHFDLVITDIMLAGSDGIEFIRWAREQEQSADTPIVAISGYDRNYLVAAISAGADEALHKPEELDKLVDVARCLTEKTDQSAAQAGELAMAPSAEQSQVAGVAQAKQRADHQHTR